MRAIVRELIETVILALTIFVMLQFSVQNFRVEGSSMESTLQEDQYLLVNKLAYYRVNERILKVLPFLSSSDDGTIFPFHPPRRGDVVIFKFPQDESRDFVKRVVGLPGDVVEIKRGRVYVNGVARVEPYLTKEYLGSMAPQKVPHGSYFVLGDNRRASNDSRDWGPVPADNLIGRALVTYWPLDRWGTLSNAGWP